MNESLLGPNGQPVISEQQAVPQMIIGMFQKLLADLLPAVAAQHLRDGKFHRDPESIADEAARIAIAGVQKIFASNIKITKRGDQISIVLVESEKSTIQN